LLKSPYNKQVKLSKTDKVILDSLKSVVEGIAEAFGDNCEVVLHSLEDLTHSCIKIENGYITGRDVGSPLTDFAIELLERSDSLPSNVVGRYYGRTDDGRLLRSTTILIRGTGGKLIGFLCVNIDLSVPLSDFFKTFLPSEDDASTERKVERFASGINDLVIKTMGAVMAGVSSQREVSPSGKNRVIVQELYKRGLFNIRGAIDLVAKEMGISRYTVYNYIREVKFQSEKHAPL